MALWALDASKSVYHFNVQNWTRHSGLQADRVNSVAQAKDGYLWLGTRNGLVRFDGQRFNLATADGPAARAQDVLTLFPAQRGGLWYALNNGQIGHFDGKKSAPIESQTLQQRSFEGSVVFEASTGEVWTGSDAGLSRWSVERGFIPVSDSDRTGPVLSLAEDRAGRIWIGTANQGLWVWSSGQLTPVADSAIKKTRVFSLAVDHEGQVWAGTERGLRVFTAEGELKRIPLLEDEVSALLVDRNGDVWAGTNGEGLARFQAGAARFLRKTDGLGSDHITCLAQDAEGSLWVGTRDGVSQITDVKFPIFTEKEGLIPGGTHTVLPARRGGVWISTINGFTYFDGHSAKNFADASLTSGMYIKSVFEARNGDLYVVSGDKVISVIRGEKQVHQLANADWPEAFAEDDRGVLVGIGPTLYRIREGQITPYEFKTVRSPVFNWITNLAVAVDGSIWVASVNGVFRIQEGFYQRWSTSEGLSSDRAGVVVEDSDGSIWIGQETGLARIKNGLVKSITEENGLVDPRIYAIVPDDHGYFWIWSGGGILRVSRDSLNACADGATANIDGDVFTGTASVKFLDHTDQGYSGGKTADGRIWLPNPRGVLMIDPKNFVRNDVPPQISIQDVRQNGRSRKVEGGMGLRLGDTIEITFAALSYLSPEKLQVRHRLEGLEEEWVEAADRRAVRYNNLPEGEYRFQVQAANADGVWNTGGPELVFDLHPPFYRTAWFYSAVGATGLAFLLGLHRLKVARLRASQAQLQAQNELLETRIAERTQELAREHALLTALLDNSPDRIYFKDTQSRYLKASQAQAESFGRKSAGELVGANDAEFLGPDHARTGLAEEQQIIATGVPVIGKIEKETHEAGREEWLLTSKLPYRNAAGEIVGIFGVSKNITAIKESEAKLTEVHRQLLETSRQAGMSEVATSVLHNVGNVLNSVNVSATLAVEAIRESKVALMPKISDMLEEHAGDLGAFFTSNPKGQKLPKFLASLGQELVDEQKKIIDELGHLTDNIEHIKEIVSLQQSFARVSGIAETVRVSDLVDQAVRMNGRTMQTHGIELVCDFHAAAEITVERHKVIHILINLIRNAEHACRDSGRPGGRVIVRTHETETGIGIAVIDDGVGIAPENLVRIFSHGFTTRKQGHGFGLHSGALAAIELGGRLSVASAGLGQGATFTLELPLKQPARTEETAVAANEAATKGF